MRRRKSFIAVVGAAALALPGTASSYGSYWSGGNPGWSTIDPTGTTDTDPPNDPPEPQDTGEGAGEEKSGCDAGQGAAGAWVAAAAAAILLGGRRRPAE